MIWLSCCVNQHRRQWKKASIRIWAPWLTTFAGGGIAPAGLQWEAATLAPTLENPEILLAYLAQYYNKRMPPSEDQSTNAWLAASWKQEWESAGPTRIHHYIWDPGDGIKGEDLPCRQWALLNHLPKGVSCFKSSMKKWALANSATYKCGESRQTADHIISICPLYKPLLEASLFQVGPETRERLHCTALSWTFEDDARKKKDMIKYNFDNKI